MIRALIAIAVAFRSRIVSPLLDLIPDLLQGTYRPRLNTTAHTTTRDLATRNAMRNAARRIIIRILAVAAVIQFGLMLYFADTSAPGEPPRAMPKEIDLC